MIVQNGRPSNANRVDEEITHLAPSRKNKRGKKKTDVEGIGWKRALGRTEKESKDGTG